MTNLNVFAVKDTTQTVKFYILTKRSAREMILEIHEHEASKTRNLYKWFDKVENIIIVKVLPDGIEIDENLYTN